MNVVLDASAAIEIALNRKHASALSKIIDDSESTVAPDLYVAEVTNALWKEHHLAGCDLAIAESAIETALDFVDVMISSCELYKEAFRLARATNHTAYDMLYLALAQRDHSILLTLDAKLRRTAAYQGVRTS